MSPSDERAHLPLALSCVVDVPEKAADAADLAAGTGTCGVC